MSCRRSELSEKWVVGEVGCWRSELSEMWVVGEVSCRRSKLSEICLSEKWAVGDMSVGEVSRTRLLSNKNTITMIGLKSYTA